jgi:hypothetical protein
LIDQLTLANSVMRRIDRERERAIACVLGPADDIVDPIFAATDIELKNLRPVGRARAFFEARLGDGAYDRDGSKARRRAARRRAAALHNHLQGADGSEHHRNAQPMPKKHARRVNARDIAQHAGQKCEGVERIAIAAQRGL